MRSSTNHSAVGLSANWARQGTQHRCATDVREHGMDYLSTNRTTSPHAKGAPFKHER